MLEPGLPEAIAEAVESGRLRATQDAAEAVRATDVSLICVGTPSGAAGVALDLAALERVCADIGRGAPQTPSGGTPSWFAAPCCPGTTEGT